MKQLIPYPSDGYPEFIAAVRRMTGADARHAISLYFGAIEARFNLYNDLFERSRLEILSRDRMYDDIRMQLLALYSYDNAAIRAVRKTISDSSAKAIRYTCQYCTLGSNDTMDHFVPQADFPELSIHAKNLVPSCSKCNSKKGDFWVHADGVRSIINPYLDQLPNSQFLYVDIYLDDFGEIDFTFYLNNLFGIEADNWRRIQRHFERLNLLVRMRNAAISHLSEFQTRMGNEISGGRSRASLVTTTVETCSDLRQALGFNHWKPSLEEALVNSDIFWNLFTFPIEI
jgi:5-methylcytosine-specific restriction endonuclease McrA